ncbi:hypothetical protein GEMRC1_007916 [Eukaryota sp. GEM-RC1]
MLLSGGCAEIPELRREIYNEFKIVEPQCNVKQNTAAASGASLIAAGRFSGQQKFTVSNVFTTQNDVKNSSGLIRRHPKESAIVSKPANESNTSSKRQDGSRAIVDNVPDFKKDIHAKINPLIPIQNSAFAHQSCVKHAQRKQTTLQPPVNHHSNAKQLDARVHTIAPLTGNLVFVAQVSPLNHFVDLTGLLFECFITYDNRKWLQKVSVQRFSSSERFYFHLCDVSHNYPTFSLTDIFSITVFQMNNLFLMDHEPIFHFESPVRSIGSGVTGFSKTVDVVHVSGGFNRVVPL